MMCLGLSPRVGGCARRDEGCQPFGSAEASSRWGVLDSTRSRDGATAAQPGAGPVRPCAGFVCACARDAKIGAPLHGAAPVGTKSPFPPPPTAARPLSAPLSVGSLCARQGSGRPATRASGPHASAARLTRAAVGEHGPARRHRQPLGRGAVRDRGHRRRPLNGRPTGRYHGPAQSAHHSW